MSFEFTAIDFETANGNRASACSIGLVKVRDGKIIDRFSSLIRPEESVSTFLTRNTQIHGIGAEDIRDAPVFIELAPKIQQFIGKDVLVAHGATFDRDVLNQVCDIYDLEPLENTFVCTVDLARKTLGLAINKLDFVAKALGLPEFEHHEATADAETAALILLTIAEQLNANSLEDLSEKAGSRFIESLRAFSEALETGAGADNDSALGIRDKRVCITGTILGSDGMSLSREDAHEIIKQQGGIVEKSVTKKTNYLVHGVDDPRTFKPGATMSRKLMRAIQLKENGQDIEIISSDEFFDFLDLSSEYVRALNAMKNSARGSHLPDYVISRVQSPDFEFQYTYEFLNHPNGRAQIGDHCIWCGTDISARAHWVHRDRHVCGTNCNEALKRSSKRKIRKLGKLTAEYDGVMWNHSW